MRAERVCSFFALAALFLSLGGCQKSVQKQKMQDASKQLEAQSLQESIARLSDVPDVPLSVKITKVVHCNTDSDQVQIFCDLGLMSRAELCSYYEAEMERIGWDLQGSCDASQEGLLVFAKPGGSLCVISLRENQLMVITMMRKKEMR